MATRNWLQNLIPSRGPGANEIKALKDQVARLSDKEDDLSSYDVKFFDADVGSFTGSQLYDSPGIDQTIRPEQMLRLYATETWVFAAVNAIAKSVAGLPLQLEKKVPVSKQVVNDVTGETQTVSATTWIPADDGKLQDLFNYPNKFSTRIEFIMLLIIDLMTTGEYYIFLDSDQDLTGDDTSNDVESDDPATDFGRLRRAMAAGDTPIKAMYRVPPNLMRPVPSEDGLSVVGYALNTSSGYFAYGSGEIIHVKLPNPTNPMQGLSPLIAAMKPILLDRFTTEHMIRFYKSGARLGGVIETEKTQSKEQMARFQRSFENNYTGRANHHRTLILPPGMKYNTIEQNPAEVALLEFCKYNVTAVLAAFNVPPLKVGILDNANYANALIQERIFWTDTVIPYLIFLEDGFNTKNTLMPDGRSFRVKADLSKVECLRENFKEKAEAAKFMIGAGLTVNEVRARVWDAAPIADGDKCQVIEQIKEGKAGAGGMGGMMMGASAPRSGSEKEETQETNPEQGLLAGMPGPVVTQVMNVLGRVAKGRLSKPEAATLLHTIHGIPMKIVRQLLAMEPDKEPETTPKATEIPQADAETLQNSAGGTKPTTGSLEDRVAQLIALFMSRDKLPLTEAVAQAIQQANTEGFTPAAQNPADADTSKDVTSGGTPVTVDPTWIPVGMAGDKKPCDKCKKEPCVCDPEDQPPKKTLREFIDENLEKLDDSEEVTSEFLNQLVEIYKQEYGESVTNKEGEIEQTQTPHLRTTKEQRSAHWKGFIEKTDPMIAKRHKELTTFFAKFKAVILGKLGANLKAYGMTWVRTKADQDDILSGPEFENLIQGYIKEADKSLAEALQYGAADTLVNFKFDVPNAEAEKILRAYLGNKIKGIVDTTKAQVREVLADGFDQEKPIAEISQKITEKFTQIDGGRAQTIARTETLTAVSMGRQAKREQWKAEFPDIKLQKTWVSAEDDHVRESHEDLDGVTIDADDTFDNGCKYPRDPDGDADEVINCRCTDITSAPDDAPASKDSADEDENAT